MSEIKQPLKIYEIIRRLPHRYPFLMVDKVLDYKVGDWLKAIKNVSINEPFFTGHFPENPVMPGVLIVEALAQAAAVLAYLTSKNTSKDEMFFLGAIHNAKFKRMVLPGDTLELNVTFTGEKSSFWKVHGEAKVEGQVACVLDILSAMRKTNS